MSCYYRSLHALYSFVMLCCAKTAASHNCSTIIIHGSALLHHCTLQGLHTDGLELGILQIPAQVYDTAYYKGTLSLPMLQCATTGISNNAHLLMQLQSMSQDVQ